ncbi:calcium-binding protein CP1-like [Lycium ferocissimum]|uniref:calcium-binding protein CP1-like n=1 Tax=Lycium ferocissimum TaxID=112874 RepID=UPI002815F2F2|nr:calcium-binding protein CP1-like [Lycium ferocissimum]
MCPTGSVLHSATTGKPNLRSAFDVLDVDRDGKISTNDLRTSYGGFLGNSEDDVIGTMMTVADSNKDGYVEFEEFQKVLDNSRRVNVMEDVFKVMDKDGDGQVGAEDLKSYLNFAGLQADDDDVKAMIKLGRGDNDENGGVTYEGFLKILSL